LQVHPQACSELAISVGGRIRVESMFDSEFAAASDIELVAAIADGMRQEAIAGARRLAAIAELTHRRVDHDDEREMWAFDGWDSAAAEVAAAMNVGPRRASKEMRIAEALRDRLPAVAALAGKGVLSNRLVAAITWGTRLVEDPAAIAMIDAALADRATHWERMSEDKLRDAVDAEVIRFDPDALRRSATATRGRDVTIGASDDDAETVSVWGQLLALDGAVLRQRVSAMVGALCPDDPRTVGERRSDALGAIANRNDTLACRCGSAHCPTAGQTPKSDVVIRVIADQTAVDAAVAEAATDHAADKGARKPATPPGSPALLLGRGVVAHPLLVEAVRKGAKITPIRMPDAQPEPRYRPSPELAAFVRMRDLFCRFPGCPVSADRCDIDHTRPWPWGPTHPSNLSCKCRGHHLMKTFWIGVGGWADEQLPDATLIWTAPSGTTYTTHPGSRLFYPNWNVTTAELPAPAKHSPPNMQTRGLMMPRRQRTRAADLAAAIKAERELNRRDIAPF
jgi:hypothetical protein